MKKIFSIILTLVFCINMVISLSVSATADIIEGPAPHPGETQINGLVPNAKDTSGEYFFQLEDVTKVDGKTPTFILLDNDTMNENSTFYVITKEKYGAMFFNNTTQNNSKFDPTNPNNIAAWLNSKEAGGFLKDGCSRGNLDKSVSKLPEGIINNIDYTHTWVTECGGVNDPNTSETAVGGKNYSVTCGVSVPSFFEFNKYKAKLGWYDNLGVNCDGVGSNIENGTAIVYASWLRTPANVESGQKTLAVGTKISDWSGKLKIVNNSKGYTRDVAVRPQFWLKKDFFKTNTVVVSTLGSDVIRVLNETYTRDDFAPLGYTPEELKLIFGEPFNIGTSSFVDNTGQQMKTLVGGADITGKIMIKNSTGIAKNMEVIIACYDADNSLLAAGLGKHSVVSGKTETPVTATMCLPSNVDGVTVRMYLWENTVNMIPYCNGIDFVPAP